MSPAWTTEIFVECRGFRPCSDSRGSCAAFAHPEWNSPSPPTSTAPLPEERRGSPRPPLLFGTFLGHCAVPFYIWTREMLEWPPREHISVRKVRSWTRHKLWPKAARGDQTSCLAMDSPFAPHTAMGNALSCTGAATWAGVTVSSFYTLPHARSL